MTPEQERVVEKYSNMLQRAYTQYFHGAISRRRLNAAMRLFNREVGKVLSK